MSLSLSLSVSGSRKKVLHFLDCMAIFLSTFSARLKCGRNERVIFNEKYFRAEQLHVARMGSRGVSLHIHRAHRICLIVAFIHARAFCLCVIFSFIFIGRSA